MAISSYHDYPNALFVSRRVAVLIKSHVNGLIPFERIIQQTTETMPKTLTAANKQKNCKLDRVATLLLISNLKTEIEKSSFLRSENQQ